MRSTPNTTKSLACRILGLSALALAGGLAPSAVNVDATAFAPTGKDFPLAGGNLANQRYSGLTQINRSNIAKLGGAWMIHVAGGQAGGTMPGTPVIIDGVMYIGASGGDVVALNAATGEVIWRYKSAFGNQANRGVAVAEGKVFTGQGGSRIAALDQKTGALIWATQVAERGGTPGATIYSDGRVFCGISGGEGGVRGQFGAYDAKTGKELWKFYTVPGPGELGNDTWEGDSWTHGGGPLWTHVAVDPLLGLVYIPVGNASPDQNGSHRGGDNLFTASILALDVKTGAYKWHYQEVHHDLWDYDNPLPPVLADIIYQTKPRKILIHGGKTGMTYILDRTNGKPLIGIEERPVPQEPLNKTARTQPFPLGDSPVPNCPEPGSVAEGSRSSCIFGAFRPDDPVVTTPGTQGGINWAPVTFNPQTNLFYVPASMINSQFASGFARPPGEPRAGMLTAMDPATNKIVWQVRTKFPLGTGSGLLSTASGLIFNGQSDGNLIVYDSRDGKELWRFQTGAGADAPVAAYEVNGEQYIAILSAGNSFQLSPRGDNLWAFKLGGKLPPVPAQPEPPAMQPSGGRRGPSPDELGPDGVPPAGRGRGGRGGL
jgi:quinohemoprotein ethanol dehydrogenase